MSIRFPSEHASAAYTALRAEISYVYPVSRMEELMKLSEQLARTLCAEHPHPSPDDSEPLSVQMERLEERGRDLVRSNHNRRGFGGGTKGASTNGEARPR